MLKRENCLFSVLAVRWIHLQGVRIRKGKKRLLFRFLWNQIKWNTWEQAKKFLHTNAISVRLVNVKLEERDRSHLPAATYWFSLEKKILCKYLLNNATRGGIVISRLQSDKYINKKNLDDYFIEKNDMLLVAIWNRTRRWAFPSSHSLHWVTTATQPSYDQFNRLQEDHNPSGWLWPCFSFGSFHLVSHFRAPLILTFGQQHTLQETVQSSLMAQSTKKSKSAIHFHINLAPFTQRSFNIIRIWNCYFLISLFF